MSQSCFFALLSTEQSSAVKGCLRGNFEALFQPLQFSLGEWQTRTWHHYESERERVSILAVIPERDETRFLIVTDLNMPASSATRIRRKKWRLAQRRCCRRCASRLPT